MTSVNINADGVNSSVSFNPGPGSSVHMNADQINIRGAEYNAFGGKITTKAKTLHQKNVTQTSTDRGEIINSGDHVTQEDSIQQSIGVQSSIENLAKEDLTQRFMTQISSDGGKLTNDAENISQENLNQTIEN